MCPTYMFICLKYMWPVIDYGPASWPYVQFELDVTNLEKHGFSRNDAVNKKCEIIKNANKYQPYIYFTDN